MYRWSLGPWASFRSLLKKKKKKLLFSHLFRHWSISRLSMGTFWTYLLYWNWENMMMEEQIWALEFFAIWTVRIGPIYVVYLECMTRTLPHWCLWVRQEQSLKKNLLRFQYILLISIVLYYLLIMFRFSSFF